MLVLDQPTLLLGFGEGDCGATAVRPKSSEWLAGWQDAAHRPARVGQRSQVQFVDISEQSTAFLALALRHAPGQAQKQRAPSPSLVGPLLLPLHSEGDETQAAAAAELRSLENQAIMQSQSPNKKVCPEKLDTCVEVAHIPRDSEN
jgi:hypothetical protein